MSDTLVHAAINCPHSIDAAAVVLRFDPKQPGHNALNQLHRRLEDQLAQLADTPSTREALADLVAAVKRHLPGLKTIESELQYAEHALKHGKESAQ